MALPSVKVEFGFDLTDNPSAPFFRLDDATQGVLDNTTYRLGGTLFYDVTTYLSAVNVVRGKRPIEQNYQPGEAEVQLNNHNRYFDPLYSSSPYAGNIVPRRELRVSANDIELYRGWIDDWDLLYTPDGDSFAIAKAQDAMQLLNNQLVLPFTPPEEKSGARIERVLSLESVGWPEALRRIDDGQVTVAANEVTDSVPAMQYLQSIAGSDPGSIYVTRDGYVKFDDRTKAATSASFVQFGGTAVPFANLQVTYGAEELFNEIVITREGGGTVTATDPASINEYGVRSWDIAESQVSTDAQIVDIAVGLIAKYSQPVYRFTALDVNMNRLSSAQQDDVLALDFGDICKVVFTPNNIGDPIERFVEIINVEHRVTPDDYIVTLGFDEILAPGLVLDDAVFGKLDNGTLSW